MCGIVGYIGHRDSQPILINGLKKLEYRGYDSAGIAIFTTEGLKFKKSKGRLIQLEEQLVKTPLQGQVGIGHTRWATHGKPSDENSHPHLDGTEKFSVVHNGIIENYIELKEELAAQGHAFLSETDTEVIPHLIQSFYDGDIVKAVQKAVSKIKGAFALAVVTEYEPDKIIAVRLSSPLIVGVGDGENYIGSDIPALLEYTRKIYILDDYEMAVLTKNNVELMTLEGNFISRETMNVDWDHVMAEKGGYDHFMLKEIHEQAKAYRDTMSGRISEDGRRIILEEVQFTREQLKCIRKIHIVACGTAYHAGLIGKHVIEQLARIPVETDVASEYRYRLPLVDENTLVIVVSQSGETADTLAALREAKAQGAMVLAITNAVGSSVHREAEYVITTWAGPEIAVASTKAYTTQLIAFYMLGLYMAQSLETNNEATMVEIISEMQRLPDKVQTILNHAETIQQFAKQIAQHEHLFFIGRGLDYATAQEGSLKLKEISYIHSEAYAAGELKHGTLALIEEGTPVIALVTQEALFEKTVSNIKEVTARGGKVLGLCMDNKNELAKSVDYTIQIPCTLPFLSPALSVIPLQLLAYYASLARGNDVDKPRNLAKSVTVE